MPRNEKDIADSGPEFAITNWNSDVALDCDGTPGVGELADVIGTIVNELIRQGVLIGSVSS